MDDFAVVVYDVVGSIPSKAEEIVKYINDFVEKNEVFFDGIKEIPKISSSIKLFSNLYGYADKLRTRSFLIEFSKNVNSGVILLDATYEEKFMKFMSKQKNSLFIANTIDICKQSKSIRATALLGYYAGNQLLKLTDVEYIDLLIIDALSNLNDVDIELFINMYELLEKAESQEMTSEAIISELDLSAKYTINKLVSTQMIGREHKSVDITIDTAQNDMGSALTDKKVGINRASGKSNEIEDSSVLLLGEDRDVISINEVSTQLFSLINKCFKL